MKTNNTLQNRADNIIKVLDGNKAEDCMFFDLSDNDYFSDGIVVATALNSRHTKALVHNLRKTIKTNEEFLYIDESSDDWIVIDMGDMIVHIMTIDHRRKYSLDEFFQDLLAS